MPIAVAVEGDTQIETSTAKHPADINQTGSWILISSNVVTGQNISVGGSKVELSATASWQYVGGTAGIPPVPVGPFPDNASLQAGPTKLTDADQGILIDGDEVTGPTDDKNKIIVTASQQILKTD